MKLKFLVLGIVALVLTGVAFVRPTVTFAQDDTYNCMIGFKAAVHSGPDTGLALEGSIMFKYDDAGSVSGMYQSTDGATEFPLVGQINGHAINLAFHIGKGQYVYGVGTAWEDVRGDKCGGHLGGPLVGPSEGDVGDWETVCLPFAVGSKFQVRRIIICSEVPDDDD